MYSPRPYADQPTQLADQRTGQQPTLYRQQGSRPRVAVPSPAQHPYRATTSTGAVRGLTSAPVASVVRMGALVFRLAAIVVTLLVFANAIPVGESRTALLEANVLAATLSPDSISGILVYQTPFGGVLRGDFVVLAVLLFGADWLCCRAAYALDR